MTIRDRLGGRGRGGDHRELGSFRRGRFPMENTHDAELDKTPLLGADDLSWFKFLLILTAHGWFLRPKAFPLARAGDKTRVSPSAMMRRVYAFVGLWLIALLLFPIQWVGGAALIWLLLLTPGLIEIHRQFQNEPDEY